MSMLELFYGKLQEERKNSKVNNLTLSKLKYDLLIDKVRLLLVKVGKESNDYRFLKRYGIIEVNGIEKLISPVTESGEIRYFVHDDELFDVLHNAHISTGHGGRDKMKSNLKTKFANVTYKDIKLYLTLCGQCLDNQKRTRNKITVKPILFKKPHSRCRLRLIDYRSQPDGDYNYVMLYEDDLTKFIILKPLRTETTEEISENVTDIFTTFGAHSVLEWENGKELTQKITKRLRNVWPSFKILQGRLKHCEDIEKTEEEVKSMVEVWMREKQTSHWADGLRYIQLLKNSAHHNVLKQRPYEAMFGCQPKRGLSMLNLTPEVIEKVETEEDLEKIFTEMYTKVEEGEKTEQSTDDEDILNSEPEMENKSMDEVRKRIGEIENSSEHEPKRLKTDKMADGD